MREEVYFSQPAHQYPQPAAKLWFESGPAQSKNTLPSLEEILIRQTNFPTCGLLLGVDEENLPLVLDLEDQTSGAFLIASDSGFDNTCLLSNLLTAALKGIRKQSLLLHLVSPYTDDLHHFKRAVNCRIAYQPHDPEIPIVLEEMVNLVISRRDSQSRHAASHIFAIDEIDLLWQALDPQSKLRLDWLIRNGPDTGFRIFATINTTHLSGELAGTVDLFPSRILGPISQARIAGHLSGISQGGTSNLCPGQEYLLVSGDQRHKLHMLQSIDITGAHLHNGG